jgi:Retrotransposon gag protein
MSDIDQEAQQIEWIRQAINAATSELQLHLESLTTQLEDKRERSDELRTQINCISTLPTPSAPSHASHLKINVPPFTGDRSTAEDFICIATTALTLAGMTDVQMQIAFVLAHLHGDVTLAWALGEQGKLTTRTHGSWDDFVGCFQITWGDADATRMAGMKMQSLKMTATADEYISAFQVLAERTGYNDAALMDFFQCGLTMPLAKSIYTRPGRPPLDLQG